MATTNWLSRRPAPAVSQEAAKVWLEQQADKRRRKIMSTPLVWVTRPE